MIGAMLRSGIFHRGKLTCLAAGGVYDGPRTRSVTSAAPKDQIGYLNASPIPRFREVEALKYFNIVGSL